MSKAALNVLPFVKLDAAEDKLESRADLERPIILRTLRDPEYRKRLVNSPKAVLEEEFTAILGRKVAFPPDFKIKVLEENDSLSYIVLPRVVEPEELPPVMDLDPDAGVAEYCTTVGCKPGYSC